MIYARQSTAIIVTIGPVLDANGVAVTDGVVGDFKASKNGGAPAALNGSATLTHRNTGHYSLSLTATDVNTVGTLEVVIDDTVNACPVKEITVIEEAIYDALFAASANAFTGAAGSTTLTALAAGSITATVVATGAIDADALATDAVQEIRDAITGGAYALSTDSNGRIRIVDGTGTGEINTNAGAIALVDLVTDITTKTGYRLSATGVDDIWDEPLAAHTTADTPGNVLNMLTQDSVTLSSDVALASIIGQLLDAGTAWSYDRATDSLEAIRDNHPSNFSSLGINASGHVSRVTLADTVTTLTNLPAITTDWLTAAGLATDAVNEIRNAITGGAYDLDTDANGRIRIVDGTGAGEIDTASGAIAQVNALGTQAKADVNAEVVDALATDTYAEPGQGAPTATTTLAAKINYLYKAWRNKKTQTSSEQKLFADDTTTVDQKATVTDDGTTLTVGEFATGP